MKKFLAIVLALAVVCSFGITAFAASSPSGPSTNPNTTTEYPAVIYPDVPEASGLDICKAADDSVVGTIPAEDVTLLSVGEADKLEDEDKAAFLAAYEAVKEIKDDVVAYFFWLGIPEGTEAGADEYVKFAFKCPGENVRVTVNGKDMEVVALEEENSYFAKLTEVGAVAILCDAE